MKEDVLDVLIYLFEYYFDEEYEVEPDEESLKADLTRAGFPESQVLKAFQWLEGLALQQERSAGGESKPTLSTRVFTPQEQDKLDTRCRGFLLFLEQLELLDGVTRELVIDRVMALDSAEIGLEQLQWVVLMILFNQPGNQDSFAWMEDLVFHQAHGRLH